MSINFSVVIPTYHRPKELMRCIMGVLVQEIPKDSYEIIVVDNDVEGSAETTIHQMKTGKVNIHYVQRFSNNVSEARNLGAKTGKGEWIAFLDDDCVPNPDWLQTAMEFLQGNSHPGLVFGGGYLGKSETKIMHHPQVIFLSKDKYLVEGNCFFRRSEYLAEGGMRSDLGPNEKRFGYHEGSELQDRFLAKYELQHKRILVQKLAVHHLESKKTRGWLAVISGFDSAFAFRSGRQKKSVFNFLRILGCMGRYSLHAIRLNPSGKERELYRVGELFGESVFQTKKLYKALSEKARLINNKILYRRQKELTQRRPASKEDIRKMLVEKQPFLAGKIGGAELLALEYMDHRLKFEWPRAWSWRRPAGRLYNNAGFFPVLKTAFSKWNGVMRQSVSEADLLCAWQTDIFLKGYEDALIMSLAMKSRAIPMSMLGRDILPEIASFRLLVVSPFVKTMQKQVTHLKEVHDPEGKTSIDWDHVARTCQFIRCPFQAHLEPTPYASWEDGLEKLTTEVASKEFDLALIGAGAWSLPLGSRIKQMGKSAIHMGGEMQLLFGIKGNRWEDRFFFNTSWVRPLPEDTPTNVNRVEDGCYW